jgi:hypothetical protein
MNGLHKLNKTKTIDKNNIKNMIKIKRIKFNILLKVLKLTNYNSG